MRVQDIPAWAAMGTRLVKAHGPWMSVRYGAYLVSAGHNGKWEFWLKDVVPDTGRVAVDVGASFGQWSTHLSKHFVAVHAFEPDIKSRHKLVARAAPNVVIYPYACWHEAASLMLTTYPDSRVNRAVDHDLLYTIGRGNGQATVQAVALDSMSLRDVDFIKVDVEGAEGHVLQGAFATLRRWRPRVLVELHSAEARGQVEAVLDSLGYSWQYRHFPFYAESDPLYWQRLWLVTESEGAPT